MAKSKDVKKSDSKVDSNLQKAIMDIAGNLEKSFRKFTKSTREKAWQRITNAEGEKEVKKIIQDPNRQLSIFAKLTFKEWLQNEYNEPREGMENRWSMKYKKSINCNNPKGFSQKNFCKRKKRGGKYREGS